jgi:hypothetical protein
MRVAMAAIALMSFVAAATFSDLAQAQTPAGSFKSAYAGKQAGNHKKGRKAQLQARAPAPAPAAPTSIYEERPGPKMGM